MSLALEVLHTPSHSKGSKSLLGEKEVFTGGASFADSIGRMVFSDSSELEIKASLDRLVSLPNELGAYPCHGPTTTIGEEKITNPFSHRPWLQNTSEEILFSRNLQVGYSALFREINEIAQTLEDNNWPCLFGLAHKQFCRGGNFVHDCNVLDF